MFGKTLGEGAFGKVKVAHLHENKKKKFAIKSIPREILDKNFGHLSYVPNEEEESNSDTPNSSDDEGHF
jgi:hypothetical protein